MRARGRGAEERKVEISEKVAVRRAHLLLPGDLLPELGGLLPDGLHFPAALSRRRGRSRGRWGWEWRRAEERSESGRWDGREEDEGGGGVRLPLRRSSVPVSLSLFFSFLLGLGGGDARTAEMTGSPEGVWQSGSGDGGASTRCLLVYLCFGVNVPSVVGTAVTVQCSTPCCSCDYTRYVCTVYNIARMPFLLSTCERTF